MTPEEVAAVDLTRRLSLKLKNSRLKNAFAVSRALGHENVSQGCGLVRCCECGAQGYIDTPPFTHLCRGSP